MMRKYERDTHYPTGHIDDGQQDFSDGLRKSMPQGYDRLGNRLKPNQESVWLAPALMTIGILLCCFLRCAS